MNQNLLKGLLVLLVVVDHNDFVRDVFPDFLRGFSFHVVGFMAIPFFRPAPALDRHFSRYIFRLYFPFFLIVTIMAFVIAKVDAIDPLRQLGLWVHSLYSGNSEVLKQTTHMAMLWYLPSFISLVIIRTVMERAGSVVKALMIAALWAIHPLIGPWAQSLQDYLPLGVMPALYVIPLAYLIIFGHRHLFGKLSPILGIFITVALYMLVKMLQIDANLYNEVGFAKVADYSKPFALLLNDLEAVTGVWMVLQFACLPLSQAIESAGKYSLQVYLFHPFVAGAMYYILRTTTSGINALLLFFISFGMTAVLTILLSRYIATHTGVRPLLFPRTPHELASALRLPFATRRSASTVTVDAHNDR